MVDGIDESTDEEQLLKRGDVSERNGIQFDERCHDIFDRWEKGERSRRARVAIKLLEENPQVYDDLVEKYGEENV